MYEWIWCLNVSHTPGPCGISISLHLVPTKVSATFWSTTKCYATKNKKSEVSEVLHLQHGIIMSKTQMGVSENRQNPEKPNGFADHYPYYINGYLISLGIWTQHFQTNPNWWQFHTWDFRIFRSCQNVVQIHQTLRLPRKITSKTTSHF